jgi:C1A family cysteine protease
LPVFAVVDFESFFKKYSNAEAVYRPGKNAKVEFYHAVVLVGYNNDHNPPYWVAKNSYGPGWGDDGFFKV